MGIKKDVIRKMDKEEIILEMQQKLHDTVTIYGLGSNEALFISQQLDMIINKVMKEKQLK
ncbi:Spo0E family sporulation regulatory protein-aspartic acid phosphatase [Neobacillus soli]|uniref:Spo0E family sporulation regulatory protein-aspartic acid phosphatase n=1 Tax=Neobacillus soli TaxID=220688 RepID=UPI000826754B